MDNEHEHVSMNGTVPPPPTTAPVESPKKKRGTIAETIRFAVLALAIVIPFRLFVAQPFIVSGDSMDPTFHDGDYLIVDQVSYRLEDPRRGDVVIFRYPRNPAKFFIKRIIGLPGETVEIKGSAINITPASSTESFTLAEPYLGTESTDGRLTVKLRDTEYFVMGDNREASSDSRLWGPLQRRLIVGTPFVRLLPVGNVGYHPGETDAFDALDIIDAEQL